MASRNIREYGDDILRKKAKNINVFACKGTVPRDRSS
ncbi:MAG: hypothetical protein PWQ97_1107 [Tepidanaerobacteraceae bacterium]|nr:hypothetical protein [Tepidanaerobacteraceae bacterium]